jgi:two-component system chemotaxis response regulator CheB
MRNRSPFPHTGIDVAAVVASADGLDAIGRVVGALPGDFRAAVVVVQHLHGGHPSRLPEILDRKTALPVQAAADGDRLAPRHVYVAPPARHVRPAGDVLFASLVGSCGPRAAAVVLSGADADGADGVRFVKAGGGLVVVQDPKTAGHPAMPEAAIATGCVDYVLSVDQIAPLLDWAARADHRQPAGVR